MRQLADYELGWLAGFYEGEGSANITNGRTYVRLPQKDVEPLEHARDLIGGNIYTRTDGLHTLTRERPIRARGHGHAQTALEQAPAGSDRCRT